MRVYIGSDHAGFELKAHLVEVLGQDGHDVTDVGAVALDPEDDYPAPCIETARRVMGDPGSLGVVIGGSGNGEQIAANKVEGIRAALAWNDDTARLAREHNDANVVSIGARNHSMDVATSLVQLFLATPFSKAPRHQRRIDELHSFESTGDLPGGAKLA